MHVSMSRDQKLQYVKRHPTHYLSLTVFYHKRHLFQTALAEAGDAFNATMKDFGYTQQLQQYDSAVHQFHAPQQHPFYG